MPNILTARNATEKSNLESRLSSCNSNANLPKDDSIRVVRLIQHKTDLSKFWCYRDSLEDESYANGGANQNAIDILADLTVGDYIAETKTDQELRDEGYLPSLTEI